MPTKPKQRSAILFFSACKELDQCGCKLLPLDYVELHASAAKAVEPDPSSVSLFAVCPVSVGKALLQVPSIGAALWWERVGKDRYGHDDVMGVIAFAYICHHGRDQERIDALYNSAYADDAMLKFRLWLGASATTAELRAGLDRLESALDAAFAEDGAENDDEPESASALRYGEIVARLCSAYHNLDPRKVLYDLSPDECAALLRVAPNPMGMQDAPNDVRFNATAAFQMLVRRLKKERGQCSE